MAPINGFCCINDNGCGVVVVFLIQKLRANFKRAIKVFGRNSICPK